jgi:hypothetical protein
MRALVLPAQLSRPLTVALAFMLSFGMLASTADAKKKKKKSTLPSVTSVLPAKASLGDIMVVKGKNFRVGTAANTVLFRKASGGKFLFIPTLTASATRITLRVPQRVIDDLDAPGGVQASTRYQIRVVAARSSAFTSVSKSPLILPQPAGQATNDCDKDGTPDSVDADDDNDGLSDALETQYKLNTCNVDTDGDGVWDSYEFQSALDLNGIALPYPGKKPWPNPLDASDINADFDGDGLKMSEEHKLWQAAGRPFPLNYSDGSQYTGGLVLAPNPDIFGLDIDAAEKAGPVDTRTGVGYLSDDERDFDGDGLSNIQEFSFRMTQGYWKAVSEDLHEGLYPLRPFSDPDPTDPDSDGDGVIDGLDDQDADGWNNISELFRRATYATNHIPYMVQPFNPCLPDWQSRSCSRYIIAGEDPWAPFDIEPSIPVAPIGWDVDAGKPIDSPTPGYVPAS